ncbi:protease SohB, partial [Pasteurella multocida]
AFMIVTLKQHKAKSTGELVVVDLSEEYQENSKRLREFSLSEETRKQLEKTQKKADKEKAKREKEKRKKGEDIADEHKPRLY